MIGSDERGRIMSITLTQNEIDWCRVEAGQRNSRGIRNGWVSLTKTADVKWNEMGMIGELAFSIVSGIQLNESDDQRRAGRQLIKSDVGPFQVRTIDNPYKRLAFRTKKDDDQDPFVLVSIHKLPEVIILGWAYGYEIEKNGKLFGGKGNGLDFYGLDQDQLRPTLDLFLLGPWWPSERSKFDYELRPVQDSKHDSSKPRSVVRTIRKRQREAGNSSAFLEDDHGE